MPQRQNEEQAIRNLQRYLRRISYEEESIVAPPIDGIFESDTRNALRAFQALKGLEETGIADFETWELLYAAYRSTLARNSPPRAVAIFPRDPEDYVLTIGSEGIAVTTLQHMLTELSFDYAELNDVTVNGVFDPPTEAAVTAFQRHNVLRQTGKVDRSTWNTIADRYNTLFGNYSKE